MNDIVQKDTHKVDIFTFDLEKFGSIVNLTISNSISWDWMKMKLTREELKGMADFLNKFLDT
jgi:hypothetical protein